MFAYFNVSEPEYLSYETDIKNRADTKVNLKLANGDILKQAGKVELVEGEFDNETGNIAFRSRFPNPDKLLRNGETGSVMMVVPLHQALVIPQKATYEIQDKKYVFIVNKNNVIKSREIVVKGEMPDLYVIESGITVNDKIVFDGIQKANENDTIQYDFLKPSKVLNSLRLHAE